MNRRWQLAPEQEAMISRSVMESAGLSNSYLILLVLSTIIATFGLLANSTATVIGAMIVAPLMGPILGTGLAYAQGDLVKLRRALLAEIVGVVLCLLVSTLIGSLIGHDNVDFGQSEIMGRTRPTLLDLAVGLAAGLAGAYARVNTQVSDSIAGVAIAVALVPPLCTSGLCASGALAGLPLWSESLGAFVLFMANFLTIQFAAIAVFALCGLGHWSHLLGERRFRLAMVINLALLATTSYFLWNQFDQLVFERRLERSTRQVLAGELRRIPGANLDSLKVRVVEGAAEVRALTRSPQELPASFAAATELQLSKALEMPVQLEIGTVLSGYVNASGTLYRDDEALPKQVEASLRAAVTPFAGCELEYFRITRQRKPELEVFLSLRSPHIFDEALVQRLSQIAETQLRQLTAENWSLRLTVRSTLSQVFNASGPILSEFERPRKPAEVEAAELENLTRQGLMMLYTDLGGGWTQSVSVSLQEDSPRIRGDCVVRVSPDPVRLEQLQQWLRRESQRPELQLEVRWTSGDRLGPFDSAAASAQAQLIYIISASQPGPL